MAEDFGFAPPPFDAAAGLLRLKRELRDLGLEERGGAFQRKGLAIARVAADAAGLRAGLVKRPSRGSPEWVERAIGSSAELRDFSAEVRRRLAQWSDDD
jgi:hypothetical protein